jgi:type III secretion protein V
VTLSEQIAERAIRLTVFEVPLVELVLAENEGRHELLARGADVLFPAMRRRASEFLGLHDVQRALDMVEEHYPAAVRSVVPKPIALALLADVLRRLVDEGHSIRDLRAVLEALAVASPQDRDPLALAELVRMQHKRAITHRVTGGAGAARVVIVDPVIEETIRRAIQQTTGGAFLALAPPVARDISVAVHRAFGEAQHAWGAQSQQVLLTQPDIRRFLRKLIELEFPEVMVVSFAELMPEVTLSVVAKVLPQ